MISVETEGANQVQPIICDQISVRQVAIVDHGESTTDTTMQLQIQEGARKNRTN